MHNKKIKNIFIVLCLLVLNACGNKIDTEKDVPSYETSLTSEYKEKILEYYSEFEKYDNFYGWIYVSGTNVSIPIAQAKDNEFYLRKNFDKVFSSDGLTFVDFTNTRLPNEEQNLVVYGHNLENQKQFSTLFNLNNEDLFKESNIYLFKEGKLYIYKPFAAYIANVSFYYTKTRFRGDEFVRLFEEVTKINTMKKFDIFAFTKESRIITLSTCTNEDDDERFVIQGILEKVENY